MESSFQRIAAVFYDEFNPDGYQGEAIFYADGRIKIGWVLGVETYGVPNQTLVGIWDVARQAYYLEGDQDPPNHMTVDRHVTEGHYIDPKHAEDLKIEICLEEEIEERFTKLTYEGKADASRQGAN